MSERPSGTLNKGLVKGPGLLKVSGCRMSVEIWESLLPTFWHFHFTPWCWVWVFEWSGGKIWSLIDPFKCQGQTAIQRQGYKVKWPKEKGKKRHFCRRQSGNPRMFNLRLSMNKRTTNKMNEKLEEQLDIGLLSNQGLTLSLLCLISFSMQINTIFFLPTFFDPM